MANRKKVKEEKTPKSKQENVTSSMDERMDWDSVAEEMENVPKGPSMEDYEKSELNKKAAESFKQELKEALELEELNQLQSNQEETPEQEPEREEQKLKLHVLADDRLNNLINRANELGITDVIQILNSDKFGQFYLVYKD